MRLALKAHESQSFHLFQRLVLAIRRCGAIICSTGYEDERGFNYGPLPHNHPYAIADRKLAQELSTHLKDRLARR